MKPLTLFILVASLSGFVLAQPDGANEVWDRLVAAESTLRFEGIVGETVLFPPRTPATQRSDGFKQPPGFTPELVSRNFDLRLGGRSRIAGRESQLLLLEPRNRVSPGWRVWVDVETGLRLAYEQRSADGRLLAEGRYLEVDRVEVLPEPREIGVAPGERAESGVRRLLGDEQEFVGFVPIRLERTQLRGRATLRVTLWDGLNGVVLLVYPSRGEVAPEGDFLQSRDFGRVTLSVLGPLPREALAVWLERLGDGPAGRLDPEQIDSWREAGE